MCNKTDEVVQDIITVTMMLKVGVQDLQREAHVTKALFPQCKL